MQSSQRGLCRSGCRRNYRYCLDCTSNYRDQGSVMENLWCHVIQHVTNDRFHIGKCLEKTAACFSFSSKYLMCVSENLPHKLFEKPHYIGYNFYQWQCPCWLFSINLVILYYCQYWKFKKEQNLWVSNDICMYIYYRTPFNRKWWFFCEVDWFRCKVPNVHLTLVFLQT